MQTLIIGSGIAGMSCAIEAASAGQQVVLVSSNPPQQAQSVMAAGGINASLNQYGEEDSFLLHAKDTLKGGCYIENEKDVEELCRRAPEHILWLESLGVVFSRDPDLRLSQRFLGGHSCRRTAFAGAATGKQIVTALVQKCREYEIKGQIQRRTNLYFHSGLIRDGVCYGALFCDAITGELTAIYADATVVATGGQNKLFGKTTGSEICDGYAAARLFTQGVRLRNLEFIQYHPTTIETEYKRMLITEGARGEGGRLFYLQDGKRVYFMEDKYGPRGNLMPRDVVSREISLCPSQVYLDIASLGPNVIHQRLQEICDVCSLYLGLDAEKQPIPVAPAIHFFMGGILVDSCQKTDVDRLYAVGECASKYHGANRLGGNSLLVAVHSGRLAAESISKVLAVSSADFSAEIQAQQAELHTAAESKSLFPCMYVFRELAETMNRSLGIARNAQALEQGLEEVRNMEAIAGKLKYDPMVSLYDNYRVPFMVILAEAILLSAYARKESRGAHFRSDYPQRLPQWQTCSVAEWKDGKIEISFRKEWESDENADAASAVKAGKEA